MTESDSISLRKSVSTIRKMNKKQIARLVMLVEALAVKKRTLRS